MTKQAASDPVERVSASGQGIERAALILRQLATRSRTGSRLTDVALASGLSKSTVHRLLASLISQRLVEVDENTGLYYLSFEMFALSASAANRFGLIEIARDCLDWLETRTGDTIFLSARTGSEAICLDRVTGSFPIKVLTLNIGDKRPLGVGAGSLALLAALDDNRVDAMIDANSEQLKLYAGFSPSALRAMVARTRDDGFSYNNGQIISGMQAIGVAVRENGNTPRIALSIAATTERMSAARRKTLIADLRVAADRIAERLAEVSTMRFAI